MLRTYRIALLSDPAYAAAVAPGAATESESDAQVLAAKTVLVDRLNQVFGEDLAIRFVLAPGSADLNLRNAAEATGANGPCGAQPCFTAEQLTACTDDAMLRTRNVVGQLLGARNYEIGHLVLGTAAGGSSYPSTAGTEYRAYGCSGSTTPTGDGFVLDRLAHELGHQLGAERDLRRDVLRGGAQRRHGGRAGLRVVGHGRTRGVRGGRPAGRRRPVVRDREPGRDRPLRGR